MSAKYTEFGEYKIFCSQSSYSGELYPKCKNESHKKANLGNLANLFNVCKMILYYGSHIKPTNLYFM